MHYDRGKKRYVFCLSAMNQQERGQQEHEMNFYENVGHKKLLGLSCLDYHSSSSFCIYAFDF